MSIQLYARNGDVRLAWEELGEGDPVLLVQGLGYTREGWGPTPALLAERFRVITFDNRGMGASDIAPPPYSIEELAADAVAVVDAAGLARVHVVGVSLGGFIAQELALRYPDRVDRLVLGCTSPGGPSAFPMPERTVRAFEQFTALPREEGLMMMVKNAIADGNVEARPELVDEVYRYRLANPPDPAAWQAQALVGMAFDAHSRLGGVRAPTLVVTGTEDVVVDPRNSELLATAIPGAQLRTIEGAGHLVFWEESEQFADAVAAFLGEGA
jgi:pimeloyl-ACP methyl ester carboxylesterase